MTAWSRAELVEGFTRLGWRVRTTGELGHVAWRFQIAWSLGPKLAEDGDPGPKTTEALKTSLARLKLNQPTMSEHFSFHEARCTCQGRFNDCEAIVVNRALLGGLEVLRTRFYSPGGLTPESWYRCPGRNREVGGVANAQHLYGAAVDPKARIPWSAVRDLRVFSGIGYQRSTGLVRHVDTRGMLGAPQTSPARPGKPEATTATPALWVYS